MSKSVKESPLYKHIDEILWNDWDPIGVNDTEAARDEYHSYIPSLYEKLIKGCDVKGLSTYLDHIETVNIGLEGNHQKNIEIAEKLINIRNELNTF